jgi:hypothetical protein
MPLYFGTGHNLMEDYPLDASLGRDALVEVLFGSPQQAASSNR